MSIYNKLINSRNNYGVVLLWVIFILGLSLRIYNLGSHNLWYDEVASFLDSNQNKLVRPAIHPQFQLYIFLLHLWTRYFGASEFSLRALSMIFGALSVLLIYNLGKLLFNRRVGLASAFILAISPLHIWYSQEARAYSLSTFLSMLMAYFFFLAVKNNKRHLWIFFVVSSVTGIYTNYFCFYILIIAGITLFFNKYRNLLGSWIVSMCFILVAFLPIFNIFITRFIKIKNKFWLLKPDFNTIARTFNNFNVGYNATAYLYFFAFVIFCLLFGLGFLRWWKEKKWELISLSGYIFIPISITFIISQICPIYLDRQLMLFSPFYYIIIAAGLTKVRPNIVRIGAYCFISLLVVFCMHNYYSYRMPMPMLGVYLKKPVKPAADYINKEFHKGDIIGYSGPTGTYLFYYLWDKIINEKIDVFSFVIKSRLEPHWRRREGVFFAGGLITKHIIMAEDYYSFYKKLGSLNFERLWFISSSWARDGNIDYHAQAVSTWLKKRFSILKRREFNGIFVDLYTMKAN